MDLLLRGANLIDGSGAPARAADVAVAGDRIAAVGPPGELTSARHTEVVELDGLTLAPGFIDVHTHYDAQILWDPDLTPSSWHGVTSVVMGNCGFGVAPTRPQHRELIVRLLENVEGMSMDALDAGIDWCFESFPEYFAALEQRAKRLNVGAFLGHSPLRLFVMGPEERPATADEMGVMRNLLRQAMDAGAIGFSTSRAPQHQGAYGRPVPSRFADPDEVYELAAVLGDMGKGIIQVAAGPGLFIEQFSELATRFGVPVTWTALLARAERAGAAQRTLERATALPGEVYPQVACREIVMQINLADPFPLSEVDAWKEVLALPREERAGLYRDEGWRARARPSTLTRWDHRWPSVSVQETKLHRDLEGIPLSRLASERGTTPFDLLLDLSLSDDLSTRFRVVMDNDGDEVGDLLADKRTLLGLSDAGAHASQLCDACFSTYLLGYWVRERKVLSLEDAVWRLTGQPHRAFRLTGRGLVRDGFFADLVAFDPDAIGITPVERVHDQPGGADRLVVGSTGVEHVWVNGVATRTAGEERPGAAPGRLLRS
jgi:N-acyl-D-aspartate/D-glutamate deacylase